MVTCPFCGLPFEQSDALCKHGCPMSSLCTLARCPGCGYEFPPQPRTMFGRLKELFRRPTPEREPGQCLTVRDLVAGARARVLCFAGGSESRHNALAVFGLVPGSEVRLIQRHPEMVLQVGETQLALEAAIAREILVEPVGDAA